MNDRWQQIEQLYHAALERDATERAAFLDEACSGDQSLRQEIESLLGCQTQADGFIETPLLGIAAKVLAEESQSTALAGCSIGPYKVLSLIGTGGMGKVYLGEDTRLSRKVALKLLSPEFSTDEDRLRRFKQEACAASALNHPNILPIYEIGETNGTDFIATEYIEGETLRDRMTGEQMKVDELLNVAEQVASALAWRTRLGSSIGTSSPRI